MFFPIIITLVMLFYFLVYFLLEGGYLGMNGTIIAAVITGAVSVIGIFIGTIFVFLRGRHHEKNEHDNLSKEHSGLSKEHEKEHGSLSKEHSGLSKEHSGLSKEHSALSKEHDSILLAQKEHTAYLAALTEKSQKNLQHLTEESIRMSEMQKQVKEYGVDTEKMIANIQTLVQMSAGNTSQIQQLTQENYSLKQDREWMREQIQNLKNQVQNLQERLKEKEQTIRELQQPFRDEPDWDIDR